MARTLTVKVADNWAPLTTGATWFGMQVKSTTPGDQWMVVELPEDWDDDQAMAVLNTLRANENLLTVRNEHQDYRPIADFIPFAGTPPEADQRRGFPSPQIVARGDGGRGQRVAVCDTGVDGDDRQLQSGPLYGALRDTHAQKHGTSCARIVRKFVPSADLYSAVALPNGQGSESSVAEALRAALRWGATTINLSLGGSASEVIDAAVREAVQAGVRVVVAAGNNYGRTMLRAASPQRVEGVWLVLACDYQGQFADFTDGRTWSVERRSSDYGVGVLLQDASGGWYQFSGTSAAAPHVSGKSTLLGSDAEVAVYDYFAAHLEGPPEPGVVQVLDDWGVQRPPRSDGTVNLDKLHEALGHAQVAADAAQRGIGRLDLELAKPKAITKAAVQAARDDLAEAFWGNETAGGLNAVRNLILEAIEPVPIEPEPVEPSPPPKPAHDSFGGSYGAAHGLAFDLYDGGYCGPHGATTFLAPRAGRVVKYSFQAPLAAEEPAEARVLIDDGEATEVVALAEAHRLLAPELGAAYADFIEALAHYMHIAVYYPEGGDILPDGTAFVCLGLGHVDGDSIRSGPVVARGTICHAGMSGLEALVQWEPSHTHCTVYRSGSLSPNGDHDGVWAARYLGFDPLVVPVPGPADYLGGKFFRGRPREDWARSCG